MTPSSDDRIGAIRSALERMTPGPWRILSGNLIAGDDGRFDRNIAHVYYSQVPHAPGYPNAAGIVLLRNEAPWLLSRLAKAEAVCDAVRLAYSDGGDYAFRGDPSILPHIIETALSALDAYDRDTEGGAMPGVAG